MGSAMLQIRRLVRSVAGAAFLTLAFAGLVRGADDGLSVAVGDPGNAADENGRGSVAYDYRIGRTEVTRGEYAIFLNAVAADDTYGLYNPAMGIGRTGTPGQYRYEAPAPTAPVAFVSWYDALRYANWVHNGRPSGGQTAATTESGAYRFSGPATVGPRQAGARAFLPGEDEWYKAAYHRPGSVGEYAEFPTGGDEPPAAVPPPGGANAANYGDIAGGVLPVGSYTTSPGPYGTFDQAGNVWEWVETALGEERGIRGGSYDDYELLLRSWYRDSEKPESEYAFVGFRLAFPATDPPPGGGGGAGDGIPAPTNVVVSAEILRPGEAVAVLGADADVPGATAVTFEYVWFINRVEVARGPAFAGAAAPGTVVELRAFTVADGVSSSAYSSVLLRTEGWQFGFGDGAVVIGWAPGSAGSADGSDRPASPGAPLVLSEAGASGALAADYRSSSVPSACWILSVDATAVPRSITWDPDAIPAGWDIGLAEVSDASGVVTVDHRRSLAEIPGAALTVEAGRRRYFAVTAGRIVRERLTLGAGWQLASLSINPLNPRPGVVLGTEFADVTVWSYRGGAYERPAALRPREGYWFFTGHPVVIEIHGIHTVCDEVD